MSDLMDRVNNCIVNRVVVCLGAAETRGDEATEKITYSLKVLLDEVEKILILIVAFGVMGQLREFLTALFTIGAIRMFVGGSHQKTFMGCLIFSFAIMYSIIFIASKINIVLIAENIIYVTICVVILTVVPIKSRRGVEYSYTKKLEFRLKAMTVLLLISRIVTIVHTMYANIMLTALLVQAIEISIECTKNYLKRRTKNEKRH